MNARGKRRDHQPGAVADAPSSLPTGCPTDHAPRKRELVLRRQFDRGFRRLRPSVVRKTPSPLSCWANRCMAESPARPGRPFRRPAWESSLPTGSNVAPFSGPDPSSGMETPGSIFVTVCRPRAAPQWGASGVQDASGCVSRSAASTRWTNCTAVAPSPTAAATRLTEPWRISPAANTRGMLGRMAGVSVARRHRDHPR
jgi:hypothetical protein